MKEFKYLIIGGGMTGDSAAAGIREIDSNGTIAMISQEKDEPYNRPPLTKGLWKGKSLDSIWRKTSEKNIEIHLGTTMQKISPSEKTAIDDKGQIFKYKKLLLATGGKPRKLGLADEEVIYFRTLADYRNLRELSNKGERFAVIGAGFIGSEIAAALAMNGKKVVLIYPGQKIGEKIFPAGLSQYITDYYKSKNVELVAGDKVASLEKQGDQIILKTNKNKKITADGVIAGIGLEPDIELAQQANLKIENGIAVDEFLRTSQRDIYAAGDVASFYNPSLEKRIRVEHEDNANIMGKLAGRNMAGNNEKYDYLPYFYSDMFELGYEAIGETDSSLEIFEDWQNPNEKGVIYYLDNARVRGVVLWNVWNQVSAARKLISQKGPFKPEDLKGRIG